MQISSLLKALQVNQFNVRAKFSRKTTWGTSYNSRYVSQERKLKKNKMPTNLDPILCGREVFPVSIRTASATFLINSSERSFFCSAQWRDSNHQTEWWRWTSLDASQTYLEKKLENQIKSNIKEAPVSAKEHQTK